MKIETVTVELLRAGPRHNQLVSPLTAYLGVSGNSPASQVSLPYEHGEFERRLRELQYGVQDPAHASRTAEVLDQTGREIAQLLARIDGVAGKLNSSEASTSTLTHLRIVLSASELAMLPFEATKVPTGSVPGALYLALQTRPPVCITRHIRSVSAEGTPWPTDPRILFVAGPNTPRPEHEEALRAVLQPWRDRNGGLDSSLTVLVSPSIDAIEDALAAGAAEGRPYSHVHVLAHGDLLDPSDRRGPTGLVLDSGSQPVSGSRLASALTSIAGRGHAPPAVVTLASCDSAQQPGVRATDASVAHDLHDRGIPLVVASQFLLSVPGSVPFVQRFYKGQLEGEHPLLSMWEVRNSLHSQFGAQVHDWASLVVYEALPSNLESQLEELRYWQARRALDGALHRLEKLSEPHRLDPNARDRAIKEVDRRSAGLPVQGPYTLECLGLKAAAHKRIGQTALKRAIDGTPDDARAGNWIAEGRRRFSDARSIYWKATKAFMSSSSEPLRRKSNLHWLLGQVISLDAWLGSRFDRRHLDAAIFAAQIDLDCTTETDRAWARTSLVELSLLRLADPDLGMAQRQDIAREVIQHAEAVVELAGRTSEQVTTTRRQLKRYIDLWGDERNRWLFDRLDILPRPHWAAESGLLETVHRVLGIFGRDLEDLEPTTPESAPAVPPRAPAPTMPPALGHAGESIFAVEMLLAANGDCLLLEYGHPDKPWRVLIDCGAKATVARIAGRLAPASARDATQAIELFVLTHIDADHIGGVKDLFTKSPVRLEFNDVWFNGWRQIESFLSFKQGDEFSDILADPALRLPWNRSFTPAGSDTPRPVVVPDQGLLPQIDLPGGLRLTLLSPRPPELRELARQWQAALDESRPTTPDMLGRRTAPPPVQDFETFDLESLAAAPVEHDRSAPNGSSIAFLAEYEGRSMLLTGDAHVEVLLHSIARLQRQRGMEGQPLVLDAMKLSHHGSMHATTRELLRAIRCQNYLVSTNGNIFNHPDREAIARVILDGGPAPTLHFNCRSDLNELWDSPVLKRRYGYRCRYPDTDGQPLRLDIAPNR